MAFRKLDINELSFNPFNKIGKQWMLLTGGNSEHYNTNLYLNNEKDYGHRYYDEFAAVQKFVGTDKLLAISECGSVPDIDAAFRDNAVWSFFGVWYGKYIQNEEGGYSEEFTGKEALIRAYNSDGALTLDEYRKLRGFGEDEHEKTEDTTKEDKDE